MDAPTIHQEPRHYKSLGKPTEERPHRRIATRPPVENHDKLNERCDKQVTYGEEAGNSFAMHRYITQPIRSHPLWVQHNASTEVSFIVAPATNKSRSSLEEEGLHAKKPRTEAGYHNARHTPADPILGTRGGRHE